ncbi:transglycosylase domain-containing protein [Faecalibaculum rodentium]|uniref:transglycosylase domain-containing protein n=1 Tax=Faecalibaculum rodentium TaxID=1702221 RepID=UPI0025A10E6E|nr:transglycosylase domain-containing protein [Faecalibaculum rodentium]
MKRFLRNCLLILLLLVTCAGGYIVWQGYEKAQEITAEVSLEQAAQRAMAAADYTPPDRIPETLKEATVAIEDRRFYEHQGLDIIGLLRAAASQFLPDMVRRQHHWAADGQEPLWTV